MPFPHPNQMKAITSIPTRFILVILCLAGAFAAAWHGRTLVVSESQPTSEEVITPTKILEGLPTLGEKLPFEKDYKIAVSKALDFPKLARNWVDLGEFLAQLQRDSGDTSYFDHAEAVYREALRLDPQNVPAMTGMAWVTGGRHDFDRSMQWANQALATDPNCPAAYGILGDAALELGNYDAAYDHYQMMMDLRPDLSSWSRGAHLLWITGKANQAILLMEKAIRAGSPYAENTAWCRARLANMLFTQGALLPAQMAIQPALDTGSKNVHVLLIAAKIAAAKQEYDRAGKFYQTILEVRPNLEALAGLGDLMAVQNKPKDAEKLYLQAEALHSANLKSGTHDHGFMARFYADRDRNLPEALRMAEEHKLTLNVLEADTLAWVYYKNGLLSKAVDAMKRALAQDTPDPEIHYHAGMIAKAYGDLASSRNHLERALAMNPHFSVLQSLRMPSPSANANNP